MAISPSTIEQKDLLDVAVKESEVDPVAAKQVWDSFTLLIPMPPNLAGLFPIADHLSSISNTIESLLPGNHSEDLQSLLEWIELIDGIPVDHPLRSEPWLTAKKQRGGHYSSPVHGNISNYPIWAMLWPQAPNDQDQPAYLALQAHLMAAHLLTLRDDRVTAKRIKSVRWDAAGRFVRLLGTTGGKEAFNHVLLPLSDAPASAKSLIDGLLAIRHDEASFDQGTRNAAGSLAEILAIVHEIKLGGPIFRDSGGGGGGSNRYPSLQLNKIGPDHDYFAYFLVRRIGLRLVSDGHATLATDTPDLEATTRLEEAGLCADEYDHTTLVTIPATDLLASDSGDDQITLRSVALRARTQAHHVAARAQRLKLSTSRVKLATIRALVLTLEETWQSLNGKEQKLPAGKTLGSKDQHTRSLLYLTAACLVTGETPSSISRCQVIRSVVELPSSFRFAANPNHRVWIKPYESPSRKALGGEATEGLVQTAPRIILPDLFGLSSRLDMLKSEDIGQLKKSWKSHIRQKLVANGVPRHWANLDRISTILPSWWSGLREADHLPPFLMFRSTDHLAKTLNHYTAVDRIKLAEQYQMVVAALWNDMDLPSPPAASAIDDQLFHLQPLDLKQYDRSWTGDDRVPRVNTIAKLVRSLQAEINDFRKPRTLRDWVVRHNAYVTYLGIALAVATGLRAIRTPIPDLSAIHRPTGSIILREKDQSDGSHARLVPLPERVIQMIDAYRSHLFRLRGVWPLSSPMLLRVPASKARDRSRYDTSAFDLDLFDTLFYLREQDGNLIAEEFSGASMKRECDSRSLNAWPSPNAGRHFLRTYLVTIGLDPNLINCLMGHWGYGEEPYVATSTMDPVIARREISSVLNDLLDHIQFEAVRLR